VLAVVGGLAVAGADCAWVNAGVVIKGSAMDKLINQGVRGIVMVESPWEADWIAKIEFSSY
jgi:hypothetical protein